MTDTDDKKYIGAVSVRKILGPKPAEMYAWSVSSEISSEEIPPSGPKTATIDVSGRMSFRA